MSNREMQSLFPQPPWKEHIVVTAEMIKDMPTPVRRYLTYTGVIGKPIVDSVRLKQIGRIRESADNQWMNFNSEQYHTTNPPHFQWIGTIRILGIPVVRVTDQNSRWKREVASEIRFNFSYFYCDRKRDGSRRDDAIS